MNHRLQALFADKHTSVSGLVFLGIKSAKHIAIAWWPEHKNQILTTADVLEGFAGAYLGFAAAGVTQLSKQVEETRADVKSAMDSHDTSRLIKPPNPS